MKFGGKWGHRLRNKCLVCDVDPGFFKGNFNFVYEGTFQHFCYFLMNYWTYLSGNKIWHMHPAAACHYMYFMEILIQTQIKKIQNFFFFIIIKITNLEDFAALAKVCALCTLIGFQASFTWSRKFPEISDNGLEQGGIRQIIPVVSRKWAMMKDLETSRFTSETEEKLSQSVLMLNTALTHLRDIILQCTHTHMRKYAHTHMQTHTTMLKVCCASQQIYGNDDVEELTL